MAVRPIDGNALIEWFRPYLHSDEPIPADVVIEDIRSMPTLTPPNEWVSVEDAVPDPGERVLATDGIFVGEAYRSSANSWFRHTGFPWRDGVTGRTVRFWMPLPAPPDRRPPEGDCEIKACAETCEECGFCDNTLASPPEAPNA